MDTHLFDRGHAVAICGELDDGEERGFNSPLCPTCDRMIRDRIRKVSGLPPLTDAEFAEIHGRKVQGILCTKPDQNGRL
jgi:hypothetical protein